MSDGPPNQPEHEQFDGRRRVVIENIRPQIDYGRFAIHKRALGEPVVVEADVFADSHNEIACQLVYWRKARGVPQIVAPQVDAPQFVPMKPLGNDRWRGEFTVAMLGEYQYTVEGWIRPVSRPGVVR